MFLHGSENYQPLDKIFECSCGKRFAIQSKSASSTRPYFSILPDGYRLCSCGVQGGKFIALAVRTCSCGKIVFLWERQLTTAQVYRSPLPFLNNAKFITIDKGKSYSAPEISVTGTFTPLRSEANVTFTIVLHWTVTAGWFFLTLNISHRDYSAFTFVCR